MSASSAHEAMPVSRSETGVAEDAAPESLPVSRSDTGGVEGAAPDPLPVSRSDTGNGDGAAAAVAREPMAPPAPPAEEEAAAPVQMHVDPLDEGIAEDQEESTATAESLPSAESPATAESPTSEEASEEAPSSEEEPTFWDAVCDKCRVGNQIWLMTYGGGPAGGGGTPIQPGWRPVSFPAQGPARTTSKNETINSEPSVYAPFTQLLPAPVCPKTKLSTQKG